jgi:hypothetical protein
MIKATKSIEKRLFEAHIAINNTLQIPEILAAVSQLNYGQAQLEAARDLYDEVQGLIDVQVRAYGRQYQATEIVNRARKTAERAYRTTLKIARIAFRDNEAARNALGLSGPRKRTLSGWLDQARRFYSNLLSTPAFMVGMEGFNYGRAKLEAEAELINAVATASDEQHKKRGDAREATKVRDAKLAELDRWMMDYKAVAYIALAHSPQTLEQLGWVVPS